MGSKNLGKTYVLLPDIRVSYLVLHPFLVVELDILLVLPAGTVGLPDAGGVVGQVGVAVVAVELGHPGGPLGDSEIMIWAVRDRSQMCKALTLHESLAKTAAKMQSKGQRRVTFSIDMDVFLQPSRQLRGVNKISCKMYTEH